MAADAYARRHGRLLEPLRVVSPAGDPAGWMVPVGYDDALLGFVQLRADGRFHRYSSFLRGNDSVHVCPRLGDWLDTATILERARAAVGDAVELQAPVLSYDTNPDRLAWVLRATTPGNAPQVVYVAGTATWIGSTDAGASEETTG